jgi:aryl-alcohol dehydrogenase-like predicted oxidoreductase
MTFGLQCDEPTSVAILDRASEGGIDFIDTSDVYPLGGDATTVGAPRSHVEQLPDVEWPFELLVSGAV